MDAFSMPWPRIATSRATGAWIRVTPSRPSRRFQLRSASGVPGRSSAATRTAITGVPHPASTRAATNPSPPLLPGPARIRTGLSSRPLNATRARAAAATAVPACSMRVSPGVPSACALRSAPGHRLRGDGGARGGRRPAQLQLVERERGELGVVGRQGRGSGGHARRVPSVGSPGVPSNSSVRGSGASGRSTGRGPAGTAARPAPHAGTASSTSAACAASTAPRICSAVRPSTRARAAAHSGAGPERRVREVRPGLVQRGDRVVARQLAVAQARRPAGRRTRSSARSCDPRGARAARRR